MIEQAVTIPERPLVVGSVATLNQLACLQPVELPSLCDLLEIRLDGMAQHMDVLDLELDRFKDFPLLFTARGSAEGGIVELSKEERSDLLVAIADRATWIDVELSAFEDLSDAIDHVRRHEVGLILSYHNFEKTPAEYQLQRIIELSEESDIVKLALRHQSVADMVTCTKLLLKNDHPMSMMGMGSLAPVSRLLYAQHGSLLNYGYLGDSPTAPGQWPAKLLKEAIIKLEPVS
ncbi:MAG: type I 3-dehydroquinate dehydratase [Akkermansiaceae bacterium]